MAVVPSGAVPLELAVDVDMLLHTDTINVYIIPETEAICRLSTLHNQRNSPLSNKPVPFDLGQCIPLF